MKYVNKIIPLILFLTIFCVGICFIISRPAITIETPSLTFSYIPSAFSLQGLMAIGQVWAKFPDYMLGFSIMAALGAVGSIYCTYNLSKEDNPE